jgi:hypothetical protein
MDRCPDIELALHCSRLCLLLTHNEYCANILMDRGILRIAITWLKMNEEQNSEGFQFRANLIRILIVLHRNPQIINLFQNFDISIIARQIKTRQIYLTVSALDFLACFAHNSLHESVYPLYLESMSIAIFANIPEINASIAGLIYTVVRYRTLPIDRLLTADVLSFVRYHCFEFPESLLFVFSHSIVLYPSSRTILDISLEEIMSFISSAACTVISVPLYAIHHMIRCELVDVTHPSLKIVPRLILNDLDGHSFGTKRTEMGLLMELIYRDCEDVFEIISFDLVCEKTRELIEGSNFEWCLVYLVQPLLVMLDYAKRRCVDCGALRVCFEMISNMVEEVEGDENRELVSKFIDVTMDPEVW